MATDPEDPEMELHARKLRGESIAPDALGPLFQPTDGVPQSDAATRARLQAMSDQAMRLLSQSDRGPVLPGEQRLVLLALVESRGGMTGFELDVALSLPRGRGDGLLHAMLRDRTRPALLVRRTALVRRDGNGVPCFVYDVTAEGRALATP